MLAGIKEKERARDDAKATAQRTAVQRVKQNWDCSQIENEEEEEEDDWQKEKQMGRTWDEDEKVGGVFGTKKDGRKFFAGGSHAKGTRISGT